MSDEHDFVDPTSDLEDMFTDPTGVLPPALVKALSDTFDYALGLRNGTVIHFSEAREVKGGIWIELMGLGGDDSIGMSGVNHGFPRGLYVRISDIVWAADAPDGS